LILETMPKKVQVHGNGLVVSVPERLPVSGCSVGLVGAITHDPTSSGSESS
jgi:hypothetical protein